MNRWPLLLALYLLTTTVATEALCLPVETSAARQDVTFVGPPRSATIAVAGRTIGIDNPVPLAVGGYDYSLQVAGWCPAYGHFELAAGQHLRIKVEPKRWLFPRVLFQTNHHKIRIEIDGRTVRPGLWHTLKGRCSGKMSYKAWLQKQVQRGQIELGPGLRFKVPVKLLDFDTVRGLMADSRSQRSGERIGLDYTLAIPTGAYQDIRLYHALTTRYLLSRNFLRVGGGVLLGFGTGIAVEAFGSLAVQITDLGSQRPLHLRGLMALVPFAGLEMGLGYHSLSDIAKNERNNFRVGQDNSVWTNIGVLRLFLGLTGVIDENLSAEIRLAYNTNMAEVLQISAGVTMRLP
jgi:hypothetical protein